ncbi:hypothetical protein ABES02_21475 [Neobacillus pocheonensis]
MYELKTKETENSVIEFIEKVDSLKKREDAYKLLDIFTETTGYPAKMWGPSIVEVLKELINQSVLFLNKTYPNQ